MEHEDNVSPHPPHTVCCPRSHPDLQPEILIARATSPEVTVVLAIDYCQVTIDNSDGSEKIFDAIIRFRKNFGRLS
ncbi:hypothetical protein Y032_0006g2883 [Ancylostoma ceylanicum]|nr:hypothetical protein Y032_0006g2883 [Ancylostoma ceylanicum]